MKKYLALAAVAAVAAVGFGMKDTITGAIGARKAKAEPQGH